MRTRWLAMVLSVLALGLVAGCGGDDDEDNGGEAAQTTEQQTGTGEVGGQTAEGGGAAAAIKVSSPEDGALEFDPDQLEAEAGEVTIEYDNPSQVPHNFTIEGAGLATDTFAQDSETLTGDLDSGEYVFFCSVPGHRQGGMEGTLVVR